MAVRFNEDTGQYIKTSEDEPPSVLYRDPNDPEAFISKSQYDQIIAQQAAEANAAAEAAAAAQAARDQYFTQLYQKNPIVSYQGFQFGKPSGEYVYHQWPSVNEDGDPIGGILMDTGSGALFYESLQPRGDYAPGYNPNIQDDSGQTILSQYESANNFYSKGYRSWNALDVYQGLSDRQPFNLNALWGGTQYGAGRVSDFSHIGPTQYEANLIASNTRNELWNQYDQLVAQGNTPPKNPDQIALDFYIKNVGPEGSNYGYGPGANTALLAEALKSQFLNQPEVVASTGSIYQPSKESLEYAEQFGAAHEAAVPTWQVFEQQGYSKDWFGSLIPMIIGSMVLGPLSTALAPTFGALAPAVAGSLIGGTTAELAGGDFEKGFLTGGITGGLTSVIPAASTLLQDAGFSKTIADAAVAAGTKAVMAGATGGDVDQAILSSLVGSGVSGVAGEYLPPDIAKVVAPVVSTALLGGDLESALLKSGLSYLGGTLKQPGETVADVEDRELGEAMSQAESQNILAEAPIFTEDPIRLAQAGDTRIEVTRLPFYQGAEGYESVTGIPSGYRLATYDEANEMAAQGVPAETLPDGNVAWIVQESAPEAIEPEQLPEAPSADISDIIGMPSIAEPTFEAPQDAAIPMPEFAADVGYDITSPIESAGTTSPYEGLEGYTPDVIEQILQGTYAGPEQTEAEITDQLVGDLISESGWTGGYDLPGGGDILEPEWTSGYDLPSGGTTGTTGGTGSTSGAGGAGGTGGTGGTGGVGGSTAPAGGADYGRMFQNIQNIFNPKEPGYPSPIKPFLAPTMLGSAPERVSEPIPDYSKIIGALASLSGSGMRSGGSVHVPGPEGRFYEKHAFRGFAVGGPGTGQSDDPDHAQ
jgi:hypothetical protein